VVFDPKALRMRPADVLRARRSPVKESNEIDRFPECTQRGDVDVDVGDVDVDTKANVKKRRTRILRKIFLDSYQPLL
jgi:hypothetical protein